MGPTNASATALAAALVALLAAALATFTPGSARADFPDERPITIVVGFPAGGAADARAHWYADRLKAVSGAEAVVANAPGAAGNRAAEFVAKAKPDGITLLMAPSTGMAGHRFLYKDARFDAVKDFTPVTTLDQTELALVVTAKSPVKSVAELTSRLQAGNAVASFGWAATSAFAAALLYADAAKIKATGAAYDSPEVAAADLAAGKIDFAFVELPLALVQQKQGKVKILAVVAEQRAAALPHVPTMAEAGVPSAMSAPWWGLWAPAGTPESIVSKLAGWFNEITAQPATKNFFAAQGAVPIPGDQASVKARLATAIDVWRLVTTTAGLHPQ